MTDSARKTVHVALQQEAQQTSRPLDPNVLQRQAANPQDSIWVGASAGSGKTKVLTDRVLRLLLPREDGRQGANPAKILCLTFTKAGAGEMRQRLGNRLSQWAVWPEEELQQNLKELLGRAPEKAEIAAARKLFAQVVDAPGGLNILTIHAFCQSVLGRFPLEAGLPPRFETLEEAQANALLRAAFGDALRAAQDRDLLQQSIDALAAEINEDQLFALIQDIAKERAPLQQILQNQWDEQGIYTTLCALLEIPALPADKILLRSFNDADFDRAGLFAAADALAKGTEKSDQPRGQTIHNWLASSPQDRLALWSEYRSAFLTAECEPRKTLATKGVLTAFPDAADILSREAARVQTLAELERRALCASNTRDLMTVGRAVLARYEALKARQGALDFDDLIIRTLELLQSMPGWALYKLDQGIDHILIDEAQDTNPEQWRIVQALCEEFFAGIGAKDSENRTVFTVGDIKQSIYSFQRAAPAEFSLNRDYFERKIRESGRNFAEIPMNISFRSAKSVLQAVDATFSKPEAARGMGDLPVAHRTFREGQEGIVEWRPLFETPETDKPDPWEPPVSPREARDGKASLAAHIAQTVADWLKDGEILPARGRPVQAGDVLILVRTRTVFFQQLARALKAKGVPVSGVDRMVLGEQLAVQDLIGAARLALLPEDDLALAETLKSPLLGWDEERLFRLAAGRAGSLWDALQASEPATAEYLREWIESASRNGPYAFFSRILALPCPGNAQSGLKAMLGRLGEDARDPLDELLNAALAYESAFPPSVQAFVQAQGESDAALKREMEEGGGKVRIMTVHGAKGLQAPIVILPDTTRTARFIAGKPEGRLLWPQKTGLPVPLWSPRKDDECGYYGMRLRSLQERADEEYRRLLYVAMTRAEDRLYIYGYKGKKAILPDTWHSFIETGMRRLADVEILENGGLRLRNPQIKDPDRAAAISVENPINSTLPGWIAAPAPQEADPPAPLTPSRPAGIEPPVFSPLAESDQHRFLRGRLTHRLLQFLPALPLEKREAAAQDFLAKNGQELSYEVNTSITNEIMAIFGHKEFAPLFESGSMAEVPLIGLMPDGRLISGQIDRLLVTPSAVFIIDYKTNRLPPQDESSVPNVYKAQMQAYADALKAVYPGRAIHAALLWTDGPRLMPLRLA